LNENIQQRAFDGIARALPQEAVFEAPGSGGSGNTKDLANATINRELAAIKRAFNLAARCTPPRVAHVPYIPMLKERNVRKGFIETVTF